MMKASIEMSYYDFSARRMLKEYYEKMYIPIPEKETVFVQES